MMRGLFVLWLIFVEHRMEHCGLDVTPSKSTFSHFHRFYAMSNLDCDVSIAVVGGLATVVGLLRRLECC
jgi:hypothetical protein